MIFKPREDKKLADMICKLNSALETDIGNWRTHWKDIAEYFNPDNDNVFGGQTTGEKKYQRLMDSYGVNALNRLTDFIHSSIFNPYVPMFYLTSTDDSVDNIQYFYDHHLCLLFDSPNLGNQ